MPYYKDLACLLAVKTSNEPGGNDDRGVNAIGWLDPASPPSGSDNNTFDFKYTDDPMRILKGFLVGSMRAVDVQKMLLDYRMGKHANPMLGIIAAYYYDAIGDIDNIRRMASFYPENNQAVPIDVAIMCRLPLKFTEHYGLSMDIPAVVESARPFPNAPNFLWCARLARASRIGGLAPVLLAGWRFLGIMPDGARRLIDRFAEDLTDAPISTFRTRNGASDFIIAN